MGIGYNPKIVTNGLMLCLDAGNKKSYPGTGTTWADLTGRGGNGTLVNGTTFSSDNNGTFVFDGSDDYAAVPGTLTTSILGWTPLGSVGVSTMTIELWVKTADTTGEVYSKPWNGGGGYNIRIGTAQYNIAPITINYANIASINYTSNISDNKYHQLVCWANSTDFGYYVDGGKQSKSAAHGLTSDNPSGSATNSNINGALMTLYPYGPGWAGNTGFSVAGNLAIFRVYNRVLSSGDVQQNFNAIRGRFGI